MPFRQRMKRAFGRSSVEEESGVAAGMGVATTISAGSSNSGGKPKKRPSKRVAPADKYADWPEHIYKPHEMPPLKYRRPPDQKHSARLQAYSFAKAQAARPGRRLSGHSLYSPMGSRLTSRLNSMNNIHDDHRHTFDRDDEDDLAPGPSVMKRLPSLPHSRHPSVEAPEVANWDEDEITRNAYLDSAIRSEASQHPSLARRRGNVIGIPDCEYPIPSSHLSIAFSTHLMQPPALSSSPDSGSTDSNSSSSRASNRTEHPDVGVAISSGDSIGGGTFLVEEGPGISGAATVQTISRAEYDYDFGLSNEHIVDDVMPQLAPLEPSKPFTENDLMAALYKSGLDIEGMEWRRGSLMYG